MRRALLGVAVAVLACTRTGSSVAPTEGGTASGATAAPASATLEPTLAELPPWMRSLFDPEPRRTYAWKYAVDVHDEGGSVAEAEGTLHCRSDGPTAHALGKGKLAWVSCQACEFEPGINADAFDTDFDDCYLATPEGLWLVDAPPSSEDETRQIVATPPYLPAHPMPRSESSNAEHEGFESEASLTVFEDEVQVMDRSVSAWCRTDASTGFYGSLTLRCFAPGFGLVVLTLEGRSGPSSETYPLVEIVPLPPATSG